MKPLALLIPGLDGTGLLYHRQVKALAERHRILAYRFCPRAKFTYQDLVEELDGVTREESPGSVEVVGESFGGTVAMHFALTYPKRVRRLVLINTFSLYRKRVRIHLGCRLAPLLQWNFIRHIKNYVVDRTLASEGILPEDRGRYREIIRQVDLPAYRRRLELVLEVDLRARLKEITVPVLLFASGRDKIVPSIEEARLMSTLIAGATVYEYPEAGHALLLTPGFCLADYLK